MIADSGRELAGQDRELAGQDREHAWEDGHHELPPYRTTFRQSLLVVEAGFLVVVGLLAVAVSRVPTYAKAVMIVAVLSLPVALVGALRPLLLRIAVRNVTRERPQGILALSGAGFSTVLITIALLLGSGVRTQSARQAVTEFGPVDVVIDAADPETAARVGRAIESAAAATAVDGTRLTDVTDSLAVPLQLLRTNVSIGPAGAAAISVLGLDAGAAVGFGGDPSRSGMVGPTPEPGHAFITKSLADELGIDPSKPGGPLTVDVGDRPVELIVDRVIPTRGIASLSFDTAASDGRNVIVGQGQPALWVGQASAGTPISGVRHLLLLSASGSPADGIRATGPLTAALQRVLEQLGEPTAVGSPTGGVAVSSIAAVIRPVKTLAVNEGNRVGRRLITVMTGLANATIIAGLMLLVTALMLRSRERARESAVFTGLGMSRLDLVSILAVEGWMFAVISGVGGALVAAVVAPLVGRAVSSIDGFAVSVPVAPSPLLLGAATGFAASMVAAVATAYGTVRPDRGDVAASAGGVDGTSQTFSRRQLLLTVMPIVALIGIASVLAHGRLWPIVLAITAAVLVSHRFLSRRAKIPRVVSSGLGLICLVALPAWLPRMAAKAHNATFVGLGVGIVVCAFALGHELHGQAVQVGARLAEWVMGRKRPQLGIAARLGASYTSADQGTALVLLTTIGLVVVSLTGTSAAAAMLARQRVADERSAKGGFDLVLTLPSLAPPDDAELKTLGITRVVPLRSATVEVARQGTTERFRPVTVTNVPKGLVDGGAPDLIAIRSGIPSQELAYDLVRRQAGQVIVSEDLLADPDQPASRRVGVDDEIFVRDVDTGRSMTLSVVGVLAVGGAGLGDLLVGDDTMTGLYGAPSPTNRAVAAVAVGSRPDAVAKVLNGQRRPGFEARTFGQLLRRRTATTGRILDVLRVLQLASLGAGAAATAAVMAHVARARRHDLRLMRALGFDRSMVRTAFLVESAAVALFATLLGVGTGLLLAGRAGSLGLMGRNVSFAVPYPTILMLVLGVPLLCVLVSRRAAAGASDEPIR